MGAVYAAKTKASSSPAKPPAKPPERRVTVKVGARGRQLRIDGTFASWYKPGTTTTGSVWDALVAPILLLPPSHRRSVLILGLGGGSAARIVRALAPGALIVGIERDPEVVKAAKEWFDVDQLGIEIIVSDAQSYLRRARRQFDLVLEDIFIGKGRSVRKPDWLPNPGLELAALRVAHGGLLVSNAIDEAPAVARSMRKLFTSTLRIDIEGYDNSMLVGGPRPLTGRAMRSAVSSSPILGNVANILRFRKI